MIVNGFAFAIAGFAAASPQGEVLFETSAVSQISGIEVATPVTVYGVETPGGDDALTLTAVADLEIALPAALRALEHDINRRSVECGLRLSGRNAGASVSDDGVRISITVGAEQWACFGGMKSRLASDRGTIRARLAPEVDYGRLQLRLVEFRVDGMSDLSRSIGLEALMRGFLKMEIDKFNDDPELTTLPEPLQREGFELTDVRFTDEDGAPSLRADVVGPNDVYAVTRVFREMTKAEL